MHSQCSHKAAPFTIARMEAASGSTNRGTGKEDVVHLYNGVLLSHRKRMKLSIMAI